MCRTCNLITTALDENFAAAVNYHTEDHANRHVQDRFGLRSPPGLLPLRSSLLGWGGSQTQKTQDDAGGVPASETSYYSGENTSASSNNDDDHLGERAQFMPSLPQRFLSLARGGETDDSLSWMVKALTGEDVNDIRSGQQQQQLSPTAVVDVPHPAVVEETTPPSPPGSTISSLCSSSLGAIGDSGSGAIMPTTMAAKYHHDHHRNMSFLLNGGNVILGGAHPVVAIRSGTLLVVLPPHREAAARQMIGTLAPLPPPDKRWKAVALEDAARIRQLTRADVITEILARAASCTLKELDTILTAFIAAHANRLTTPQLRQLLHVLNTIPKHRLFNWLAGRSDLPWRRLCPLDSFGSDSGASCCCRQWDTHFVAGQMLLSYLNVNHPRVRRLQVMRPPSGDRSSLWRSWSLDATARAASGRRRRPYGATDDPVAEP